MAVTSADSPWAGAAPVALRAVERGLGRRSVLGIGAAAVLATVAAGGSPAQARTEAADILMFIRHGEDPTGPGEPFGITAEGHVDSKRSLTVRGWTRAGALVTLFDPRDAHGRQLSPRPELARPTTIVAHDPGETDSKRSFETASPLAAALGLQIDRRFTATQTAEVAAALSGLRGATLVAWKHENIAQIISHLGHVEPTPPAVWPEHRYDMVYVLHRTGERWRFTQVPQMLLAGDSAAPLGPTP